MGVSRRRAASSRGADLISCLGSDVLVRILELLPDAGDAVRTGELSRRWRGLWTRAGSLTFDSTSSPRFKRASGARRFLAMVSSVLAQRAMAEEDDAAVSVLEHLAIAFLMGPVGQQTRQLVSQSSQSAQEWILYALQSTVRSFDLELGLPVLMSNDKDERPMIDLSQLPSSSANLQSLRLKLDGVGVFQLPNATAAAAAAAAFPSLVDLSLEGFEFVSDNLVRFLSSAACCPRLQKLRLKKLRVPQRGTNLLKVEATALLELSCEDMQGAWVLVLKTPSLRALHLVDSHACLKTLVISAPRLEELTFLYNKSLHMFIDGDELPCVRSLNTELQSHSARPEADFVPDDDGVVYDINYSCICLLHYCTSLTSLEVSLGVLETGQRLGDIISGRIPHLTHLVSLIVNVCLPELHSFGVGLADILAQCSNVKYLRVHCSVERMLLPQSREHDYLCDHLNHWKSQKMHLPDIKKVEVTGLTGTQCELWFMRQVLARTTHLQKVTLSLSPMCRLAEVDDKYFQIQSSMLIPGGGGGTWTCQEPCLSYEWEPDL